MGLTMAIIRYKKEEERNYYSQFNHCHRKYTISGAKEGYHIAFSDSELENVYLHIYIINKKLPDEEIFIGIEDVRLLHEELFLFLIKNINFIKEDDAWDHKLIYISRIDFINAILPQMEQVLG